MIILIIIVALIDDNESILNTPAIIKATITKAKLTMMVIRHSTNTLKKNQNNKFSTPICPIQIKGSNIHKEKRQFGTN